MNKAVEKTFNLLNPWRTSNRFLVPQNYIVRTLEDDIEKHLDDEDMSIIYGSRQTGKTTLIHKLIHDLYRAKAPKQDLFYLAADNPRLSALLQDPGNLLEFVLERKKKAAYVFIDEAQYLTNPGIFLKTLYDYKLKDVHIIATGSSTLEIKSKVIEYLPGRKKVFTLYPLSFQEVRAHDNRTPQEVWNDYIIFGGYPKVFLAENETQKKRELKDIHESYIKKDISSYLAIEKPEKFNHLASLLAYQISGLVNKDELTNTLGIHRATVEKYIAALEDTFIISQVYPYFSNKRTEISKMPKAYFLDLGLRNAILNNFNPVQNRGDMGKLAENFVFTQLFYNKTIDQDIHFWRTKSGAEVDFAVSEGPSFTLYEVKYGKTLRGRVPSGIRSFSKKYPKQAQNRVVITSATPTIAHKEVTHTVLWEL